MEERRWVNQPSGGIGIDTGEPDKEEVSPFPDINLDLIGKMFEEKMGNLKSTNEETKGQSRIETANVSFGKYRLYDPARPNDYEKVLKERELQAEAHQRELLEEDYRIRNQLYNPAGKSDAPPEMVHLMDNSGPLIERKIVRMLEKHGWEYGKGIGAEEKGMVNPLVAVKTSGQIATIKPVEEVGGSFLPGMAPQQSSQQQPSVQAPPVISKSVIYQSGPVVEDPRIKPIQEKYFRA
jgi:hypothetical protein